MQNYRLLLTTICFFLLFPYVALAEQLEHGDALGYEYILIEQNKVQQWHLQYRDEAQIIQQSTLNQTELQTYRTLIKSISASVTAAIFYSIIIISLAILFIVLAFKKRSLLRHPITLTACLICLFLSYSLFININFVYENNDNLRYYYLFLTQSAT